MSIGTKIFELRTAMNLSQGNLADILDVSRQSVSKWETDAAVPDLDKLIKLCDVFHVTLDELTCREVKQESHTPSAATIAEKDHSTTHQKIIGYILLTVSLLAGMLIWIFAEREEDLYIPIPLILSVLTCSLICLFVKLNAGYWCVWAVAAPIVLLSPYSVGLSILTTMNTLLIILAVIMTLAAGTLFAGVSIMTSRKKSICVVFGWIALVGLRVFAYVLVLHSVISSTIEFLPCIGVDLLSYVGTSLLLTYTVCYIKNIQRTK